MALDKDRLEYFQVVLDNHWHDGDLRPMAEALLEEVHRLRERLEQETHITLAQAERIRTLEWKLAEHEIEESRNAITIDLDDMEQGC